VVRPKVGRYWAFSEETFNLALAEGRVYFGRNGDRLPVIKRYADVVREGVAPRTWWPAEEAGTNQSAKRDHLRKLLPDIEPFATPKPEQLLRLIVHISTNPGELVLDSFLGSGTTAAVAHKMGRRYIGIEMGNHAITHCVPRLQKVIEGEQGGISEAVGWQGGGGFRFYKLGVPVFDENGQVSPYIRFAPLAAHLWFVSTGIPYKGSATSPFLGEHEDVGYYLLFNGILGDLSADGGNVLTGRILASLPNHDGQKVIFGESCRLSAERLQAERITFRQIPYEIKAR
jgi:adenine-specific DNA-methyltransferase